MTHDLDANKRNAIDFYRTAYMGDPRRAVELYVGALDDITGAVVHAALTIHRDLGPGPLESVYVSVLYRSLERRGLKVER